MKKVMTIDRKKKRQKDASLLSLELALNVKNVIELFFFSRESVKIESIEKVTEGKML